jgi:hypothetical protein
MRAMGVTRNREPSNFSKNDGKYPKGAVTGTHYFPQIEQNNVNASTGLSEHQEGLQTHLAQ